LNNSSRLPVSNLQPVPLHLSIYGDDRSLLDVNISGDQAPREIKIDIAAVKRLKIVVDYGQNLDTGDWLNLCEARLIK
jgi:hypothetical protein